MGLCSFPVSCLAWGDPVLESAVSMVGPLVTSKKDTHLLPGRCCWWPVPTVGCFQPTPLQETFKHSQASLPQSYRVTAPFSWVLVHTRFCLCPSKSLSFPQSCISVVIKSHCPKSDSLGISSPFAGSPEPRTFRTVQEFLWYYCSPVCGLLTQWVWGLILSWLHPFYHKCHKET